MIRRKVFFMKLRMLPMLMVYPTCLPYMYREKEIQVILNCAKANQYFESKE